MKNIIRGIKRLFGEYEDGYEYWVYLKDIVIPCDFLTTSPNRRKLSQKFAYFRVNRSFESKIKIARDFVLRDGYTSYIIARKYGFDKVPVYFVNDDEKERFEVG